MTMDRVGKVVALGLFGVCLYLMLRSKPTDPVQREIERINLSVGRPISVKDFPGKVTVVRLLASTPDFPFGRAVVRKESSNRIYAALIDPSLKLEVGDEVVVRQVSFIWNEPGMFTDVLWVGRVGLTYNNQSQPSS